MLALGRKRFEKIMIGDDIVVTILRVGASVVTVGVEAPKDVRILRSELQTQLQTEIVNAGCVSDAQEAPGTNP